MMIMMICPYCGYDGGVSVQDPEEDYIYCPECGECINDQEDSE